MFFNRLKKLFVLFATLTLMLGSCGFFGDIEELRKEVEGPVESLNLSGQVYWQMTIMNPYYYSPFNGNLSLTGMSKQAIGGSGKITGGQLSFYIGKPNNSFRISETLFWNDLKDYYVSTVSSSISEARFADLYMINADTVQYVLRKQKATSSETEEVYYLYSDRVTTISVTGAYYNYNGVKYINSSFNLALNKGWNAIYRKGEWTALNEITYSISLKDPSGLYWVLCED